MAAASSSSFGYGLGITAGTSERQLQTAFRATKSFSAAMSVKGRTTVRVYACAVESKPKKKLTGIMRPRRVSPEMQELVGEPEISRAMALKVLWAHIKQNNLQDAKDKRIIVCDEKLKKIFGGRESVKFLEIAGLITPHFL